MKAILMSIQSKWLAKILDGEKTVELRKRFPKDYRGWVYLYCTKSRPFLADFGDCEYPYKSGGIEYTNDTKSIIGHDAEILNGKVVARVWVDNVEEIVMNEIENCDIVFNNYDSKGTDDLLWKMSISFDEFLDYHLENRRKGKNRKVATSLAIYFSKLEIFDKPKELNEFHYYKKRLIDCGMDCPPYFDEVKTQVRKAPQSWQYVEVEK